MADRNQEPKPRELPATIEGEQSILGDLMMYNDSLHMVSPILEPSYFFEGLHANIYIAIQELMTRGTSANPLSIKMQMSGVNQMIGKMTIGQYLSSLTTCALGHSSIVNRAKGVREAYNRRRLIEIGEKVVDLGYREGDPSVLSEQGALAQAAIGQVCTSLEDRDAMRGEALMNRYLNYITVAADRTRQIGVPIALPEIQAVLSERSFEGGNFYGMLSSSGEGKTSLTMQLLYHALVNGHPTCMFSFDQSEEQIVAQIVAQHKGLEVRRQKSGDLTDKDFDKAVEFSSNLTQMPFEIIKCDSTSDNVEKLLTKAGQFMKHYANGLPPFFVIDHSSAIPHAWEVRGSDEGTKAAHKGNQLKTLAKKYNAAVLLLLQRSGGGVARLNPRPIPSDVFGGEAARQPFDAVFSLFRADEHMRRQIDTAKDEADKTRITARFNNLFPANIGIENRAEIQGQKVRFGRGGLKRYVTFVPEFTKYESVWAPADIDQVELL